MERNTNDPFLEGRCRIVQCIVLHTAHSEIRHRIEKRIQLALGGLGLGDADRVQLVLDDVANGLSAHRLLHLFTVRPVLQRRKLPHRAVVRFVWVVVDVDVDVCELLLC